MKLRGARRPGHSSTTAHCQAAYPFIAEAGIGAPGAYIGRDAFGGAWLYDPWVFYEHEVLADQNMLVLGQVGSGKSAFVKSYLYRQRLFARQSWVIDVKGEYGPLVEALEGTMIALAPGGKVRLNPISPRGDRDTQLTLLRSVAKAALRRELGPEEDAGLRVALDFVNKTFEGTEPVLPEIVDVLLRPREEMVRGVSAADSGSFASANRLLALALQRLCEGDLHGMFDGPTTEGLDLDASIVVLDLSAVRDSAAVGILMTCASAWLQAILMERKRVAEATGHPGIKMICVIEEGWRVASHIGVAEWLQESFKLCRSLGVQTIFILHSLSDLGTSGAAGSREARIAENLIADAGTKIVHRQAADQIPMTGGKLAMSAPEREILPTLRRGEALWIVGQHRGLAQTRISSHEHAFTYTDARATQHSLVIAA